MLIKCNHWQSCGVKGGGCCSIKEYNKPSWGICLLNCKKNTHKMTEAAASKILEKNKFKKSTGLGDTVKNIIDKVTRGKVKPCTGCQKRQAALNKIMPYKGGNNAG